MIETKEEYEELRVAAAHNWNDMHDRGIFEIIEALREGARLLDRYIPTDPVIVYQKEWNKRRVDFLDAIPDWIKE